MEVVVTYLGDLLSRMFQTVVASLLHNWYVIGLSIIIAVGLKVYVNTEKLSSLLMRRRKVSVIASVLFGAFTPLCACGTSAVLIGMLTTTLPWGPIMAFLTSSPLMSPDGFVFISGIISLRFAVALTIASLVIGILSGFITNIIEKKTHYLDNQSRYLGVAKAGSCACSEPKSEASCSCSTPILEPACACSVPTLEPSCTCADTNAEVIILNQGDQLCCATIQDRKSYAVPSFIKKLKLKEFLEGIINIGFKQILLYFSIFIAVGYLINNFIPTSIISALFGVKAFYAVPLASLIGLPLYLTTGSGIPIIQSMMENGASQGAMLAFIITGSATSAWVIAGLATFMKKRAIALYIAFILIGGIISGYVFDLVQFLM